MTASGTRPARNDDSSRSAKAYALIDDRGNILHFSAAFGQSVENSGTMTIRAGRLAGLSAAHHRQIEQLIARGLAGEDAEHAQLLARIANPGHPGIIMRFVQPDDAPELFVKSKAVAALVLVDFDAPLNDVPRELREAWGLTKREAELAELLALGRKLDEAADILGMSEHTARYHLRSIFRRMDIDRQSELVRLVVRLCG